MNRPLHGEVDTGARAVSPSETQHEWLQKEMSAMGERIQELERVVRRLSDGHGLTPESTPRISQR